MAAKLEGVSRTELLHVVPNPETWCPCSREVLMEMGREMEQNFTRVCSEGSERVPRFGTHVDFLCNRVCPGK